MHLLWNTGVTVINNSITFTFFFSLIFPFCILVTKGVTCKIEWLDMSRIIFWTVSSHVFFFASERYHLSWKDSTYFKITYFTKLFVLLCVCVCVCVYVLSPQGLLLPRIIPEPYIRLQVNNSMLSTLLRCLCQFSLSLFLNLSSFTLKDKTWSLCKSERKWYIINDAA